MIWLPSLIRQTHQQHRSSVSKFATSLKVYCHGITLMTEPPPSPTPCSTLFGETFTTLTGIITDLGFDGVLYSFYPKPMYLSNYVGGCSPKLYKARRKLSKGGRFKRKISTVARPIGVKPMTKRKSLLQQKCSFQSCWRGLYKATCRCVTGSVASSLFAL